MNESQDFIDYYFDSELTELLIPSEIKENYNIIACLGQREDHASYLICHKKTAMKYVLKTGTPEYRGQMNAESSLLGVLWKALQEKAYHVLEYAEGPKGCYFLRPYVEGESLDAYANRKSEPDEEEILRIALQLAETIEKFHRQEPPLIHRDIKPNNIILQPDGKVTVIDFDAAKRFNEKKKTDTKLLGTEGTAAPEQYGYSQSDERTDIFAFGKVLCYLYTQDFEIESLNTVCFGKMRHLIYKCCTFSPADRYSSMQEVSKALKKIDSTKFRKMRKQFLTGMVCTGIVLAFVFFFLGNHLKQKIQPASVAVSHSASETIVFESIAMRRGVCEALGVSEESEITYGELERITNLFILGDGFLKEKDVRDETLMSLMFSLHPDKGYIRNLDLCSYMTNLRELIIFDNEVTDISGIKDLKLRILCLNRNCISDFSALENMTTLEELYIGDNSITKLPKMKNLSNLRVLNLDLSAPLDITELEESGIEYLSIKKINTTGYSALKKMSRLRDLELDFPDQELLDVLPEIASLESLQIFAYYPSRASIDFSLLDSVKSLIVTASSASPLPLDSVSKMKSLEYLSIGHCCVIDAEALKDAPKLTRMYVNETTEADDFRIFCSQRFYSMLDDTAKAYVLKKAGIAEPYME